ncbi:hypothetical protein EI555_020617 [Monodon monoceros]|uniref:14-3-3 domain-containing protein n=1 Tax=Monodon monoceros TaxID=40151 RepID=A0A4U1F5Y7_MONMO|nr:hypothetical protein EI555_020617 [Monodon monoceros]
MIRRIWYTPGIWPRRLNDRMELMKKVAGIDVELTVEEINFLSVVYKIVIEARRASWRIISSIKQKEETKKDLDIPDKHLIPAANTGESKEGGCKEQPSSFKAANDIAMTELPPTHPIYLALALNFTLLCDNLTLLNSDMQGDGEEKNKEFLQDVEDENQ